MYFFPAFRKDSLKNNLQDLLRLTIDHEEKVVRKELSNFLHRYLIRMYEQHILQIPLIQADQIHLYQEYQN